MTNAHPPTAPQRSVPTRRISFEESLRDVPRHFAAGGDVAHSHFCAALSALFPDGEDFFVASVRRFRDRIDDPELKQQVNGFIGQEAMHGREHRAFNNRLAELGYPTHQVERAVRRLLDVRSRLAPAKANLAVTAALEHYTATMAEHLLTSRETRELFGNQRVLDLFLWHALEESEHKAVAFDVYRAVGGGETLRRVTMNIVTVGFVLAVGLQMAVSLALDPAARRPRTLLPSLRRFVRSPIFSRQMWRRLRDYNRVGFHPDDHDSTDLVEHWRSELFGADGTLNDKLAGARS